MLKNMKKISDCVDYHSKSCVHRDFDFMDENPIVIGNF